MTKTLAMTGFPGGGGTRKQLLKGKKFMPHILFKRVRTEYVQFLIRRFLGGFVMQKRYGSIKNE